MTNVTNTSRKSEIRAFRSEYTERMSDMAAAAAREMYAEASRICGGDTAAVPAMALRLFRAQTDSIDNHLAYLHWDAAVANESAYGRFCGAEDAKELYETGTLAVRSVRKAEV